MKKIICKKEYDTETSTVVKKITHGNYGEKDGYEEILYMTPEGLYFIYVNGGIDSLHPGEDISRISKAKAEEWISKHTNKE